MNEMIPLGAGCMYVHDHIQTGGKSDRNRHRDGQRKIGKERDRHTQTSIYTHVICSSVLDN